MVPGMLDAPEKTGSDTSRTVRRLFPFILFFLALLPRVVALNRYITPDELVWMYRAIEFREALLDGRWEDTLVAGHPGVTTTWLGATAISAQIALSPADRQPYEWLTTMAYLTPDNTEAFDQLALFLSGARLAVAVVNALGVVAVYVLVARFWGTLLGILTGLLLALDPFVAGLSGLLHVDGLSTTWATLSLLLLLPAVSRPPSNRPVLWLALSGLAGGLAVWTKTPTGVAAVVATLAIVVAALRDRNRPFGARLVHMVSWGAAWAIPFLLVGVVLLPALWAAPQTVFATLTGNASRHLEEALRPTFFLGQTGFVHGPLFYPVSLLWRLSPVVVAAAVPALFVSLRRDRMLANLDGERVTVWPLVLWVLLFTLVVTLAAKKFDRYILPVIPVLVLLAGMAWTSWRHSDDRRGWLGVLVVAQAVHLALFWWTPLSAYNPLVGGPWTAQRVLPIGWAEGISFSGSWLSDVRLSSPHNTAVAGVAPSLSPFFIGQTLVEGYDDPATADYVILTAGGRQTNPAAYEAASQSLELLETIRYGGLEQAWIFYQPDPQPDSRTAAALPEPVGFGGDLALTATGLTIDDDTLVVAARWQRMQPLPPDATFVLRIGVTDAAGNQWASMETDLLNAVYFFPPDWTTDDSGEVRYVLELPPAIPPGEYAVNVAIVDSRSNGQLPVQTAAGFGGVSHTVGEISVVPPDQPVSTPRLQIAVAEGQQWLDGALRLLGRNELPEALLAGSEFPVDLFWHAELLLPGELGLMWALASATGGELLPLATTPLSRYDTGLWRVGESIQEKYRLSLPPELESGVYSLLVQPVAASVLLGDFPHELGQIMIDNIDRQYAVPNDIGRPLDALFGDTFWLRGIRLPDEPVETGEHLSVTLVWQAAREPEGVFNVFVHLLDEGGNIVAQSDHWPGGLPTDIWARDQVVVDQTALTLPADLPPGRYSLAIGLYDPATGDRLPLVGGGEGEVDRLLLSDAVTTE